MGLRGTEVGQGRHGHGDDFPDSERGYATGTCQMHVVQHQKPDLSKEKYSLEVWIKDANQKDIGSHYPAKEIRDRTLSVTSKLPKTVEFKTGARDADPIEIEYSADIWSTDDERCNVVDYDNGRREMNCDFECKM